MTTIQHSRPGPVLLDLTTSIGTIDVTVEDIDTAVVELHPEQPDDETALDLIARAEVSSRADEFAVRLPRTPGNSTTIVRNGHSVSINTGSVSVGNIVIGNAGGVTVVNGRAAGGSGTVVIATGGGVRLSARLPRGSSLTVDAGGASVRTTGHLKAIRFAATSGDLRADGADRVHARSQSGDIEVRAMDNGMLKSMSGDIHVDGVASAASISTMSGGIRAIAGSGAEIDADAMSGNVTITGDPRHVSARSMSGHVRIPKAAR
ncbi:DUF4097 family beta strand repeat-containing protein [Lentzea sp. NPDC092896]|uniref:DUF4097 family beta strand repeat-containing protein n=1 Tax=Lentzea sp. NPDC092896 TaxID=3364127 RepID=UPI0038231AAE